MTRLAILLCLLALPAVAADYDTVAVATSATNVTSGLTNTNSYKTILVENGNASNAIYCSRDPAVTTNTGHKVAASDGWRSFPYDGPIYCISATASQDGTNRNHTIVWGSYQ